MDFETFAIIALSLIGLVAVALTGGLAAIAIYIVKITNDPQRMSAYERGFETTTQANREMVKVIGAIAEGLAGGIKLVKPDSKFAEGLEAIDDFVDEMSDGVPIADKQQPTLTLEEADHALYGKPPGYAAPLGTTLNPLPEHPDAKG